MYFILQLHSFTIITALKKVVYWELHHIMINNRFNRGHRTRRRDGWMDTERCKNNNKKPAVMQSYFLLVALK